MRLPHKGLMYAAKQKCSTQNLGRSVPQSRAYELYESLVELPRTLQSYFIIFSLIWAYGSTKCLNKLPRGGMGSV